MARKKPTSGKARKVLLQQKRATKAANHVPTPFPADLDSTAATSAPSPSRSVSRQQHQHQQQRHRTAEQRERDDKHEGRMKLESRFIRLPKHIQEHHRNVAATDILRRPIDEELGVLRVEELQPKGEEAERLTCPKRPKWSYNQSKKEVEKNEEGVFRKWLSETDETLAKLSSFPSSAHDDDPTAATAFSPTFYERNLNVWRQLWRTTEISEILLVLIDVRFPLLHYPPSLRTYLHTLKPRKPLVLVLTKTDLVPRWLAEAWKTWFEETEGEGVSVVLMESYREEEKREETQGTQPRFIPAAPPPARHALLSALRSAHASLLTPPPIVACVPERLARWSPHLRREVDWDSVEDEGGETGIQAGGEGEKGRKSRRRKGERKLLLKGKEVEGRGPPFGEEEVEGDEGQQGDGLAKGDDAYPFLTVGLIGQPNVGKSSLLNALLGRKVVRASRTPGKTKTLQTIYWNAHLRLCDCPGLVCPSSAGLERQVLAGILPIQNVEPVLHFIGQRVPLEKVLKLRHPEGEDEFELNERGRWTTDELLSEYAIQQGFVTAKVGRPDIYRSGAHILRQLHSSSIPWGFRPPFAGDAASQGASAQEGIYLVGFKPKAGGVLKEETREEESASEEEESESDESASEDESLEEADSAEERAVRAVKSVFAALDVEGGEDSDTEE
ncbi:hypothetical protein JCM1841_001386 [Sporobolomyces salmonicolor]